MEHEIRGASPSVGAKTGHQNEGSAFMIAAASVAEKRALAPDGCAAAMSVCRAFESRCSRAGVPVEKARPEDMIEIAMSHRSGRRPKEHAERVLRLVADVIRTMVEEGSAADGDNPAVLALSRLEQRPRNDPTTFLPAEVETPLLLAMASARSETDPLRARDLALAALCLGAGASPSAVARSSVSGVAKAIKEGSVVLRSEGPTIKRPEEWTAPLLPEAVPALARWLELSPLRDDALLLPGRDGGPLSRSAIRRAFVRICLETSGLSETSRALCPQSARNSYFARLVASRMDHEAIRKAMGWSASDGEQTRRMMLALEARRRRNSVGR